MILTKETIEKIVEAILAEDTDVETDVETWTEAIQGDFVILVDYTVRQEVHKEYMYHSEVCAYENLSYRYVDYAEITGINVGNIKTDEEDIPVENEEELHKAVEEAVEANYPL